MKIIIVLLFVHIFCMKLSAQDEEQEIDTEQLDFFRKHPVNLNEADEAALKEIIFLSDLQIESLLAHRRLLGKLISIYELQAIPYWDIDFIKKILPYVSLGNNMVSVDDWKNRISKGDHRILLRVDDDFLLRYRYQYKNLFQYGITTDAAFYSAHVFIRNTGMIQSLALGDFTVNMGQGLMQWQTLAFKKSAEVLSVKRQSSVLKPYSSAGRINFYRGAGITIKAGDVEVTGFGSYNNKEYAYGGSIKYRQGSLQTAVNMLNAHHFSIDYNYTHRNFHFFGEAAVDKHMHKAFINGLLISAARDADIAIVHRSIGVDYKTPYGNAFTESSSLKHETGTYIGIRLRLMNAVSIDAYADFYKFSWPSWGRDYMIQLNYKRGKTVECYTRFRNEVKEFIPRRNWRTQINCVISKTITVRNRVEMVWYNSRGEDASAGFMIFFDLLYKPSLKPFSGNIRLQYFETDDFNARIYAYESDVLYSYALPAFSQKGHRCYINFNYDLSRRVSFWCRIAGTFQQKTGVELKIQTLFTL